MRAKSVVVFYFFSLSLAALNPAFMASADSRLTHTIPTAGGAVYAAAIVSFRALTILVSNAESF